MPGPYSAYSTALQLANAEHFYRQNGQTGVLIMNDGIDFRNGFWDESLTMAMIRLNYYYSDFVSFNKDELSGDWHNNFLFLKSQKGSNAYPEFEKIAETKIEFGDTVSLNFPDSIPMYMEAEYNYTLIGMLSSLFYQSPIIYMKAIFSDSTWTNYRILRAIVKSPVLINKAVISGDDLRNYFTDSLKKSKNITSIIFLKNPECQTAKFKFLSTCSQIIN